MKQFLRQQLQNYDQVRAIKWSFEDGLYLLDQRYLPHKEDWVCCNSAKMAADAITDMVVRGAPAIGVTAGWGCVLSLQEYVNHSQWKDLIAKDFDYIEASRPTAINLHWAIGKMRLLLNAADSAQQLLQQVSQQAQAIADEDIDANYAMAELGLEYVRAHGGGNILTHCNTGSLATGGLGTALGVIRACFADGQTEQVFADETRPWLQGARLTAWELAKDQIPVKLIAEGAAGYLMQLGKVKWIMVGADRITADGDVANKVGTYNLAVLAKHHGIKMMVVAPSSTFDLSIESGDQIPVEFRDQSELLQFSGQQVAPQASEKLGGWNPVFDVTPANLIDCIVTERGVIENPNKQAVRSVLGIA
ncbi:S-methyl-5-thioribose-1-phosphate isomerase [Pelagibaculum spongiae]|uniref:Methylthioribose-1-phosphate isomerase n=1 Tax=Pelagibaculum spongiae TaxID=2080658 RepID=A0A2V1H1J8_9GAMM|nr:S-methyl-5-thioribose-1-phosphate isomerase [Pelagibaculum spongiae]PVZ72569.1 S-methyl-5-thioribose-1-phosphate isomerase [Pelagibaculum spongiae]